jgi:beta-xylosidase
MRRTRPFNFFKAGALLLLALTLLFVPGSGSQALAQGTKASSRAQTKSQPKTFQNPVLWEDLADIDVIRVGDTYYYSASNMHYSPGAPLLRSYDLVNWEYIGHSVPVLDFGPEYDLNGGSAYV